MKAYVPIVDRKYSTMYEDFRIFYYHGMLVGDPCEFLNRQINIVLSGWQSYET